MQDTKKPAIANGETLADHYPQGIDWNKPLERITLVELFDRAVKQYADHPCIDFLGTKISFRELDEMTARAAKGFQKMGVTKGTRVGFYMPNTHWHPVLFFGALKAGAIIVNYSPQYAELELLKQVEDSGTTILVTSDLPKPKDTYQNAVNLLKKGKLEKVLAFNLADAMPKDKSWLPSNMRRGLPLVKVLNRVKNIFNLSVLHKISYLNKFMNNDGKFTPVPATPDDTAVLQYTGGTTGVPKGAELTHYNVTANVQQLTEFITDGPGKSHSKFLLTEGKSKLLGPLPNFHVFGMTTTMIAPIYMGLESIMLLDPRDLETALKVVERTKPDAAAAVPKLVEATVQSPLLKKYDYSSLKGIVTGGAAMPTGVHKTVMEKCDARIFPGWGLTETSPVLTVNPITDDPPRMGSAGIPLPGTEIRVCDVSDPEKVLEMGQDGELQARGPQIMKGYWNNQAETDNVMVAGGWFRTGDIGHITGDGHIIITDRLKRMINVGGTGKKAFATQIENAISEYEGVAECVVVAINKGTPKEAAKAFVRAQHGKEVDDVGLRAFLAKRLTHLEIPKYIEFVTEPLPVTAVGKPDWKKLEDMEAAKAKAAAAAVTQSRAPGVPGL